MFKVYVLIFSVIGIYGCSTSSLAPQKDTVKFSQFKPDSKQRIEVKDLSGEKALHVFMKVDDRLLIKKCSAQDYLTAFEDCAPVQSTIAKNVPAELFKKHILDTFALRAFKFDFEPAILKKKATANKDGIAAQDPKISKAELETEKQRLLNFVKFYCDVKGLEKSCDDPMSVAPALKDAVKTLKWEKRSEDLVVDINKMLEKLVDQLAGTEKYSGYRMSYSQQDEMSSLFDSYLRLPSLNLNFIDVPAGQFTMGSPKSDKGRWGEEEAQVKVTLSKKFALQTHELTQNDWYEVMGTNPSFFSKKDHCPKDHTVKNGVEMCPALPVESFSWNEMQNFITKLNFQSDKMHYRLPTEAEWEYAARAGTETIFTFSNTDEKLPEYGWYQKNSRGQTQPIGTKKPNPWGFYDMPGNVWEWTQVLNEERKVAQMTDPVGPETGSYRVVRGGSWFFNSRGLRSASRCVDLQGYRGRDVGVRLVRYEK